MWRYLLIALIVMIALSGCKTLEGLGKDMQKAGEWVEDQVQ